MSSGAADAVRRLAAYRPFDDGGRGLQSVLRDLVMAAAEINDGEFPSLADCQSGFLSLWQLDVEIEEIRMVRDQLIADGLAEPYRGGFRLRPNARDQLQQRAAQSDANEATAFEQWEEALVGLAPDLSPEDLASLRNDLSAWLHRIIARHGVEAALMLYPEEERAHRLFEEIDSYGTAFLPRRERRIASVRDEALRRFVRQPTPEQRVFLANRLNTAFFLTVLTLDPSAAVLAQADARRTRLYLDTNFLYSVLGVAQPAEVMAAHRLLDLTKSLGYEVAVTPWTVEELHQSIKRSRREVVEIRLRPELAQLMSHVTGEKGYGQAFWSEFQKSGVTPADYFDKVSHFEHELPRLEIAVIDEGCTAIDRNIDGIRDYASLLERIDGPGVRHRDVIEHDVKHRLLVERLRGAGRIRFSNARYWFLTQDNRLPGFAQEMPEPDQRAPELAFCISPSSWTQVVRALTPRTVDFEGTVVDLLTSPFVGYRGSVNQQAVREVVGRIDQYEDASPELALAVLKDTALVRGIAEAEGEDVEARVRAAYSTKTHELQELADEHARAAAAAREARAAAEARAESVTNDLEAEIRRREGLEADIARERQSREASERALGEKLDATARDGEAATASVQQDLEKEREERERLEKRISDIEDDRRRTRRSVGGYSLALAAALSAILLIGFSWVGGPGGTIAVVVGAIVLGAIGLLFALGREVGGYVLNIGCGLAGLAGIVLPLLL